MSRIRRVVVVLVGLVSLCAIASSADAVTWHNSGDTTFTADSSSPSTITVTGVNRTCTGSHSTGTAPSGSFIGVTYPALSMTTTYQGCSLGGLPYYWTCRETFTTSSLGAGTHPGNLDTHCEFWLNSSPLCVLEGQRAADYIDPVSPSTHGRLVLTHAGTLRMTDGPGGGCVIGSGHLATTTPDTRTITGATGGPAPHLGPVITRTA